MSWHDAESAFEAWKKRTRGRPCDYTGLSYAKLRGASDTQWPCNEEHPDGTERLYADGGLRPGGRGPGRRRADHHGLGPGLHAADLQDGGRPRSGAWRPATDREMLAQAAQGIQHLHLLALAQRCHPDTLRQMKWANAAIKENSTQLLVS